MDTNGHEGEGVRLAGIFRSGMVLQRELPVPVWGWAAPGDTVTVEFKGQAKTAVAGGDGQWRVVLDALSTDVRPATLVVSSKIENQKSKIDDVLVGEVWLIAGQSNAGMSLRSCREAEAEIAAADDPLLRHMTNQHRFDGRAPCEDAECLWQAATPEAAGDFHAVPYFFGRRLRAKLNTPVGLLALGYGGSCIEAWMSRDALAGSAWGRDDIAVWDDAAMLDPEATAHSHHPAAIFNGKVAPLIPFALRGAVWYQGEDNTSDGSARHYGDMLPRLIADWRRLWRRADLPFLLVQLPNFTGRPQWLWPQVREAVFEAAARIPQVRMVVTIDVGDPDDIHPSNKAPVGERLALQAMALRHGWTGVASGPLFAGAEFRDGAAWLSFTSVGGGLVAQGGPLRGFALAGADLRYVPAEARIVGDQVRVSSPRVPVPAAVRYGWKNNPDGNLFNAEGLPASPFRTDRALRLPGDAAPAPGDGPADLADRFRDPPPEYRPTALYWLNGTITPDEVTRQLTTLRDRDGYGSVAILPVKEYWEEDFLDRYGRILETLDELGMWALFCDDMNYPSGSAGGALAKQHPGLCARQLYKTEWEVAGPAAFDAALPEGALQGCVAMAADDPGRRLDITAAAREGRLRWDAPAGRWKVLAFVTRRTADPTRNGIDLADYLNPEAVDTWISLTYQRFYDRFPSHFGTTIRSSFFDDIGIFQSKPGPRMWEGNEHTCWTDGMNARFREKYGLDPVPLLPALWYDIGPGTAAARVMFFGLRADLLADACVKRIADWCARHGIDASGHPAGDYELSPMAFAGDAIKFYKHAQRPLVDAIFYYGHGRDGFKLAGSAAVQYDRPIVQCETYGAFQNGDESKFTPDLLYRTAMELFTRGINLIIPHGVWYAYPAPICPPEISGRNPVVGPSLRAFSDWIARCQLLLQGGRHVADVAVLYPIETIMADCHFGDEDTISDYQEVGERLTRRIRQDFTFLHPEVLAEKCSINPVARTLDLPNAVNRQQYRVLIVPGRSRGGVISAATLEKIVAFHAAGGTVIFTSKLPSRSAEPGRDTRVGELVRELFGVGSDAAPRVFTRRVHPGGGKAFFIPDIDAPLGETTRLAAALDEGLELRDVRFEEALPLAGQDGELTCIHKVRDGRDYYFFANSSDVALDTWVRLRGRIVPEALDPHTGEITPVEHQHIVVAERQATRVHLVLGPNRSLFIRKEKNR